MDKIIMVGAGGHSKSVADSLDKNKYELVGFIDENKEGYHLGKPIIGKKIYYISDYKNYKYLVAIGDVDHRRYWYNMIVEKGLELINIIDKTAIVANSATIGTGNFIGKLAILNADSTIGDNNIINTKALIEHECKIGNHTHISTNATLNGNIVVEDNVFMGSTAVCNGQLRIGEHAIIGSGSVVINNVEPNCTVVGCPAGKIRG